MLCLARVELQLVMRCLRASDIVSLALTCHVALHTARDKFAWGACPATQVTTWAFLHPDSLVHFATIDLEVGPCALPGHIIRSPCRTLRVHPPFFTLSQIAALYAQPGLREIQSLHLTNAWIACKSVAAMWIQLAPRAFPSLTSLEVECLENVYVDEHADGVFACLTSLHIHTRIDRIFFRAPMSALRELHVSGLSCDALIDVLSGAPRVEMLYLRSFQGYLTADFWRLTQCVTMLSIPFPGMIEYMSRCLHTHRDRMPLLQALCVFPDGDGLSNAMNELLVVRPHLQIFESKDCQCEKSLYNEVEGPRVYVSRT
jgi:hypothetical protein